MYVIGFIGFNGELDRTYVAYTSQEAIRQASFMAKEFGCNVSDSYWDDNSSYNVIEQSQEFGEIEMGTIFVGSLERA